MTSKVPIDAFNVSHSKRHPAGIAWVVLICAAVLTAVGAQALSKSLDRSDALQTRIQTLKSEKNRLQALAHRQKFELQSGQAMAKTKAEQELRSMFTVNWDAVLDALEMASYEVHGGVTILSFGTSRAQMDRVEINITALANSSQSMLTYVQYLSNAPLTSSIDIVHQQPDAQIAPEGHKFQLTVVFNPLRAQPLAPRPEVAPAALNKVASVDAISPALVSQGRPAVPGAQVKQP